MSEKESLRKQMLLPFEKEPEPGDHRHYWMERVFNEKKGSFCGICGISRPKMEPMEIEIRMLRVENERLLKIIQEQAKLLESFYKKEEK